MTKTPHDNIAITCNAVSMVKDYLAEQYGNMGDVPEEVLLDIIKELAPYDSIIVKDEDTLLNPWDISDVKSRRPDLSDDQCREVLERLKNSFDAEIGINWDVIDCAAEDLYTEPDNIHELREDFEF